MHRIRHRILHAICSTVLLASPLHARQDGTALREHLDAMRQRAAAQHAAAADPAAWLARQRKATLRSEALLTRAEHLPGLLPQYLFLRAQYLADGDVAFRAVFGQYLSWYQTFVGDYPAAARSFAIAEPATPDDAPSPLTPGARWQAADAVETIVRLARGRRAVFFNENHSAPQTRTLTVQLLARLRAEGFDTFAAETLYADDMDAMAQRGYPTDASGFYTREPVYAFMLRRALALGYRVVAYEAESGAGGDAREREQAENLYRRVHAAHPQARLLLNAGYGHVQKRGDYLGGRSMAQHYQRISGIEPLVIEQTMLFGRSDAADDHPYWRAVMQALAPRRPIVFTAADGTPWSLRPGAYDISVFFPESRLREGRPDWLDLGGLRQPYTVHAAELCLQRMPCLVEARRREEPISAVPLDRLLFADGQTDGLLWLPPGRYRLTAHDSAHRLLRQFNIEVRDTQKQTPGTRPGVAEH